MIKSIAWNTFKQTGDINSYLEFKEVKNIEENFIKTTRTKDYSEMVEKNHKYQVKSKYKDACLRETSITLNDLEY